MKTNSELKSLGKMCGAYPIAKHMFKNGYPIYMSLYLLTAVNTTTKKGFTLS